MVLITTYSKCLRIARLNSSQIFLWQLQQTHILEDSQVCKQAHISSSQSTERVSSQSKFRNYISQASKLTSATNYAVSYQRYNDRLLQGLHEDGLLPSHTYLKKRLQENEQSQAKSVNNDPSNVEEDDDDDDDTDSDDEDIPLDEDDYVEIPDEDDDDDEDDDEDDEQYFDANDDDGDDE
eukprot:TRINITY_DN3745_c1_g1_i3.p3 TRINITY_DN3745_c1_g1~~TRINITY_DN3745_c1_g1_i3.p3  ORF type:complete len:204 (-),score=28.86 TRINITY_DN3745_c1_g1_i3:349-888(-)